MVGIGTLRTPLKAVVQNGQLQCIEGEGTENLEILFEKPQNGIVAELGIGTNEKALLCGNTLEDEKVYGTVHIAFGTNTSFGLSLIHIYQRIMYKCKSIDEALFYVQKTMDNN